jgi:hypothetical protein
MEQVLRALHQLLQTDMDAVPALNGATPPPQTTTTTPLSAVAPAAPAVAQSPAAVGANEAKGGGEPWAQRGWGSAGDNGGSEGRLPSFTCVHLIHMVHKLDNILDPFLVLPWYIFSFVLPRFILS